MLRTLLILYICKEEQLVFNDRTAKCSTVNSLGLFGTHTEISIANFVTAHHFIVEVHISATSISICTRFRNGIDACTDKVCLTHVVWGNHNLYFINGIQ